MVDPYWVTADEASHLSLKAASETPQISRRGPWFHRSSLPTSVRSAARRICEAAPCVCHLSAASARCQRPPRGGRSVAERPARDTGGRDVVAAVMG
jgi:hypothetical protein